MYCYQDDYVWQGQHPAPSHGAVHKHEFIELLYVIDGAFSQVLMGEQLRFKKGTFVITDQSCEHSDCFLPEDGIVFFLQISSSYMDELLYNYNEADELQRFLFHALARQKKEQSFLELKANDDLEDIEIVFILKELFEEYLSKESGYEHIRKGLLIRLLNRIYEKYTPILHSFTQEDKEKAILFELERYIRIHYDNVTAHDLESIFHYHRNYYNLLLKKYRNKSFKQYVLDIRLSKAQELLKNTTLPIKEIARLVGYENTSHFYRLYKNKYHRMPR